MGACASAPREGASELAVGPDGITSGSRAASGRAASKGSKGVKTGDARRGRDMQLSSDSPRAKHEAPRSARERRVRGGSLAAVVGTSDATRLPDASSIRPSDAFESPDRVATGGLRPLADRRDSARLAFPDVHLDAHERPANPYARSWPRWLIEHAGDVLAETRPRVVSSYLKIGKVGQGTYGAVYRGYDLERRRHVALKKIKMQNMDDDTLRFICREIITLRSVKHPNVVELLDVAVADAPGAAGEEDEASRVVYLSFEFVEHDLAGLLSATRRRGMRPGQTKRVMLQLFSALAHCHERGVLHRDVKGSNLLVDNDGNVKLADFGLAVRRAPGDREPLTSTVVTLWYRPPELLLGATAYDERADMWSAGCLLAELLMGKPAFAGQTEVEQLHRIFQTCGSEGAARVAERLGGFPIGAPSGPTYPRRLRETFAESPNVDPHALDLLDALLSLDPRDRGSAAEATRHPYFSAEPVPEPLSLAHMPNSHEYTVRHNIAKSRSSGVSWTRGLVLNEGDDVGGDDDDAASEIHSRSSRGSSLRSGDNPRSDRSAGDLHLRGHQPRSLFEAAAMEALRKRRGGRELAALATRHRGRGDGLISLAVRSTSAGMGLGLHRARTGTPARHVRGDAEFAEGFARSRGSGSSTEGVRDRGDTARSKEAAAAEEANRKAKRSTAVMDDFTSDSAHNTGGSSSSERER